MKAILLALMLTTPAWAIFFGPAPKWASVVPSSNNIPNAFDQTAGSKMFSGLSSKYGHLKVYNGTATRISVITSNDCGTSPSSTSSGRLTVESNEIGVFDDIAILDCVFIQSEGSAISSSTFVSLAIW